MPEPTERAALRWAGPVSASNQLTPEQQQRVQALRAAREVLEAIGSGSAFARPERTATDADELQQVAAWIMDGATTVSAWPDREDAPEPVPAFLHAKDQNDDRLCGETEGLATVFWVTVAKGENGCPDCRAEIARRAPNSRAGKEAAEPPVAPPNDAPTHYYVKHALHVACGLRESAVANWVTLDEQEKVTCEGCILKLHEHGHRTPGPMGV